MSFRSRLAFATTSALVLALISACGDDPTAPPTQLWQDVSLPNLGAKGFMGIAARGSRVVAVGVAGSSAAREPLAVQSTGGTWQALTLPATPAEALFVGVAIDVSGSVVFVGVRAAEQPIVLDERAGWQTATLPVTGYLNAVVAGQSGTWIAVGTASGGLAATSTAPGVWVPDNAGFTTLQEKGLVDVTHADSAFVACGWDDTFLGPVLRIHDNTGWKALDGPGTVNVPEISEEYRSVLLEPGGALWLGGASIDTSQFPADYSARLARRPASGDWFEVVLPNATNVEAINDILRASDGSLYLACGENTARVLRYDGMIFHDEGPGTPGQVLALAEDGAGRIYAAGVLESGTSDPQPLLRVRNP